ncbi:MAG: PolC-type DNA polymerase III [Oscillospiraceae bacterium]|nr:PolC-type DNA polymerase III [Oscillospiraceae bacterium]
MNPVPLFEMFPFIRENSSLASDYSSARVTSVKVNSEQETMSLVLALVNDVPPFEIGIIEELIKNEFGLKSVTATATGAAPAFSDENRRGDRPRSPVPIADNSQPTTPTSTPPKPPAKPTATKYAASKKNSAKPPNPAILGRATKVKPIPLSEVDLDLGRVTVSGEVFSIRNRFIEKINAWLINFDITDYTSSITITKFMRGEDKNSYDKATKVAQSIKQGMHLIISGNLSISKYDNDLVLDPQNIVPYEPEQRMDTAEEKRIELHLHTKMSEMDALTDTVDAIKKAAAWGHPAIAITDHGVLQSFPTAAVAASRLKSDIKIIYGVEGYFRNDSREMKRRYNHITLLVKNQAGMKNLYELVTKSHLENYNTRPIIFKSELTQLREGLIIGSACESGEVFEAIVQKKSDEEIEELASFYDYFEIMPICNNNFMIMSDKFEPNTEEELRDLNRKVLELGRKLDKPVVATGDVHFLDPEHEVYRKILQTSKGYKDATSSLPLYLKTTVEMLEEFSYLGKETAFEVVVKNTQKIAEMCETVNPLPEGGKLYVPTLDNSTENLRKLVFDKSVELYGENMPVIIKERIEYELNDILGLGYGVIYMAAQKLVSYLREQHSRVGSRGSVGSSMVAHLAGITEVNPMPAHYRCPNCKNSEFSESYACGADMPDKKCPSCGSDYAKDGFNIPFETFMGFDGDKVPDIDLNIASDSLSEAHKYVYEMFGEEHVFRAGTIGTLKERNAYKAMKKYLEVTGKNVSRAEENRLLSGCLGVKATTGQHPGGLIVIPQDMDLSDFCPAQYPSNDSEKGVTTLHYEYGFLEDNLIKLDVLGHDNPTMLKMLENMTGIDADEIKLDDPDTMALFTTPTVMGLPADDPIIGETGSFGIPEFGTPFVRQMLCDTKPKDFDALIRISGFSHGTNVWLGNAKDLIENKTATVAETISSRDDIMLYLISKGMKDRAAFKVSENIRKGKGIPSGMDEEMKALGVPKWYIDSCNMISYLFPKAHAVAYVDIAFRIAWFKMHRPLEFYSAHFYRRRKSFAAETMTKGIDKVKRKIEELKANTEATTSKDDNQLTTLESCYEFYKRGFQFTNIDIYESDAEKFLIVDEKTLRPPFAAISGMGETAAFDLAEQRKSRQFVSEQEILAACPSVNKNIIAQLKSIGALRDLPTSSQMSLF